MDYLKSFVIGSSFPVFIIFFISIFYIGGKNSYTHEQYAILAPLYFGIMNMLSLYLSKKFDLELRSRLFITSIISIIFIICIATILNYEKGKMAKYYLSIIILHLIAFNIILYTLEKNIEC